MLTPFVRASPCFSEGWTAVAAVSSRASEPFGPLGLDETKPGAEGCLFGLSRFRGLGFLELIYKCFLEVVPIYKLSSLYMLAAAARRSQSHGRHRSGGPPHTAVRRRRS